MSEMKSVLVFGATGNVGGATARELLKRGWHVRAVTRTPDSKKARALFELGADVVQGDMDDRGSLERVFEGMTRVFSVQNWATSGVEAEIRQGKLVAEVAKSAGIRHLVYSSAGSGEPDTGVPHLDSKLEVEAYMRGLGLPFTIVRPGPFMEMMTEREFFPPLGVWGMQTKIMGWDKPIPWIAVRDIGIINVRILEDPETWIGKDLTVFGDVKTMRECKKIFADVDGKQPFGLTLPLGLFKKMAGEDLIKMWGWLDLLAETKGRQAFEEIAQDSRRINPVMFDLKSWLKMKRSGSAQSITKGQLKGNSDYL